MHTLRASDYKQMPWKNGGGVTTEIAVSPLAASAADFDWRISMAIVASDGPFSTFDNIDRTLTILDGNGIELDIERQLVIRLTSDAEPFAFPGDVPTAATLIAGPVTDLNVMTRRGSWTHAVTRQTIEKPFLHQMDADVTMIFCCEGKVQVKGPVAPSTLATHDTLVLEKSDGTVEISADGQAPVLILRLFQQVPV